MHRLGVAPAVRKRRQLEFWHSAWARCHSELAADKQRPSDEGNTDWQWSAAMGQARAGDWAWLDELVQRVVEFEVLSFAPSPALWPALDAFFAAPPDRRKGKKRRVDRDVALAIRASFAALTTQPGVTLDAYGATVRKHPPLSAPRAREILARDFSLSPEAIRDIVERRKTYRSDL